MDSLAFLDSDEPRKPQPVYVLHGDEDFLKRQVMAALRPLVLGPEGQDFGMSSHDGDKADFAAIHDELQTLPFLSPRRLVVVDHADTFVSRHRAALEKYLPQPAPHGVLVLDVKSWPSNTRLYKMVNAQGSIGCKAPPAYKLPPWCVQWAAARYNKQLVQPAAALLVDLIGADMGQLDQELNKLSVYVGKAKRIDTADVDQLVGSSRAENIWKIFDAIGQGQVGEALALLGRLFDQGEEPLRILGAFSMQLRRLAQASRLAQRGLPVPAALERAGVPSFGLRGAEQLLRHLGPRRLDRVYDWLLEADQGLKGGSQLPPRVLMERLVVRLARGREDKVKS